MLNVVMLNVIMLNVIMVNVFMLRVMAPKYFDLIILRLQRGQSEYLTKFIFSMYQSTEIVLKILVSEIILSLTFAYLPFWELGWSVK
jgi:hypothetical protein